MRKFMPAIILVLFCEIFTGTLLQAQSEAETPFAPKLKVFVKPLQGPDAELAKTVRVKLVDDLTDHGISVVESEEYADAILSGSGLMQTTRSPGDKYHFMHVRAAMRLVNKNGVALWAGEASSSKTAVSESSSFAENVVKKVAVALAEESKRKSSEPVAQKTKGMD